MNKIKGIYAASMSILNKNLSLNIDRTILHAESLIDQGCHGVVIFGSTGQAQLISVSEKIGLLNHLSTTKYKSNYLIGTGFNSLTETINTMKVSCSLNLKNFLIMLNVLGTTLQNKTFSILSNWILFFLNKLFSFVLFTDLDKNVNFFNILFFFETRTKFGNAVSKEIYLLEKTIFVKEKIRNNLSWFDRSPS